MSDLFYHLRQGLTCHHLSSQLINHTGQVPSLILCACTEGALSLWQEIYITGIQMSATQFKKIEEAKGKTYMT